MTSSPRLAPPPRRRVPLKGAALFAFLALTCAFLALACGSSNSTGTGNPGNASDASSGTDAPELVGDNETIILNPGDGSPAGDAGSYSDVLVIPENFVPTEHGGYALGPPTNGDGSDAGLVQNGNSSNCSLVVGIVRDFASYQIQDGGHPDFERFNGSGTKGLVQTPIGSDRKPVYAGICDDNITSSQTCPSGQQLTTQANFDEWYRYTPNVNAPYLVYLQFVPNGGVYTFESDNYFPLDNAGFGNTPGFGHNFSFTTELHLKFTYNGGETFAFSGDDDLWVFINGTLAIDLGGLHSPLSQTVSLDNLGLTKGSTYDIELFNAERHSTGSNFRVDTNLSFTNCGTIPPDNPPK